MTGAAPRRYGLRRAAYRRGRAAEAVAAAWLRLGGYRILARGVRTPVGEIDIIARRGGTLAVVEVKSRASLAAAAAALPSYQRRRIVRALQWYLAGRPQLAGLAPRFDVVLLAPGRRPRHLRDAWSTDGLGVT
ncbi:MAG: YraN family protein [Kiloniellales bacterium]